MGSILNRMYDDMDEYDRLCTKYNVIQGKLYSIHYDWLIELDSGKTTLSFPEYEILVKKKKLDIEISNLEREIKAKKEELKNLKSTKRISK